jgi:hypothetical protein
MVRTARSPPNPDMSTSMGALGRVVTDPGGGFAVASRGTSRDTWWALAWLFAVVVGASVLLVVLVGPLHVATGGTGHVAAVLAFLGVLVTAAASIIGLTVTRQPSRATEDRLRLDSAMRAGRIILFSDTRAGELRIHSFELARTN